MTRLAAILFAGLVVLSQSPPTELTAQIDSLIKEANEQMNVKGQFQLAAELAKQALDLSEKTGDKSRMSTAMVYLSAAYGYQGRLAEALDVAQKNLAAAREIDDKRYLEEALNTVAGVLGESGRYEESLSYLYQCLAVAREIDDANMQYMSQLNIGAAYVRSGDAERAEPPLQEALRLAAGLKYSAIVSNPSKKGREMALLSLGDMEMLRRRYQAALNYYGEAHTSGPDSPLWAIAAIEGMAAVHEQIGEPQKAIDLLAEAIPQAEKTGSGLLQSRLVSQLGVNQEALGYLQEALASENRALAIVHQAGGNPDSEWQIEGRIGHIERALRHADDALAHYRKSIDGIEHLRAVAVNTDEGRAAVLARSSQVYAETADLLYDMSRAGEALAAAEQGRARAFLDLLAQSRLGVADERTSDQRAREQVILSRISAAQRAQWKPNISAAEKKDHEGELAAAEQAMEALQVEIRRSNPRYASVQYPEPLALAEIQSTLLDDHTAMIEYLLGDKRSLAWIATKNRFQTVVLPPRKDIEDQAAAYSKLLARPVSALTLGRSLADINRAGSRLYGSIFKPVVEAAGDVRRLIIVPDGGLDYLPFEALVTGSSRSASGDLRLIYLAQRAAIVYGPSASALLAVQTLNRKPAAPAKMLLAFADPSSAAASSSATAAYAERGFSLGPLPYARGEVLAIGKLFPLSQREIYLGGQAREETLKTAKLDDYRFIHFATHGFMDEAKPARSGIFLSRSPQSEEDGILQMGEIMRLKLNADLVTLSACGTGLGKLVSGEGILGLTRSIFYAGARNVTVSLWNVNDSATATLMQSFYRNLTRLPKDEALRQAKLSLMRSSNRLWQHPYYWAAFVMEGEGR